MIPDMYSDQPLRVKQQAECRAMLRRSEDETDWMQVVHQRELATLLKVQASERLSLQNFLAVQASSEVGPLALLHASARLEAAEALRVLLPLRFSQGAGTIIPPAPVLH